MTRAVRWALTALPWILAAAGCGRPAAGVPQDILLEFDEANREFLSAETEADYARAAARYQAIVDRGIESHVVLYNLGNAWMRASEPGRAIAAYRRAERLAPRDPLIAANLELALAEVAAPRPERTLAERLVFWQRWMSLAEKTWAVTCLLAAAVALGAVGRVSGRAWADRIALACGLLAVLMGLSLALDVHDRSRGRGVVVGDEVVARKGAAESYAEAFTEPLREGMEFRVLERSGDWIHVELAGGLDGWIPQADVETY